MGLFNGLGDVFGKTIEVLSLGTIDDPLGTEAQQRALAESGRLQAEAGQEAISALQSQLLPYTALGSTAARDLRGGALKEGELPIFEGGAPLQTQDTARVTAQDVLSDPFFQALSEQQTRGTLAERAALGLASSGGTEDMLTRNLLQLGEGFRQQREQEQLGRQAQQFGQQLTGRQLLAGEQQQGFNQALAAQQARFNQLFGTAQLGQQAATTLGTGAANLLTGMGAVQGAVPIAQAQANQQATGDVLALGGTALGAMFGGPAGAAAGSSIGSALGGSSPAPVQPGSLASFIGG
jgi:hypothetical protein